MEQLSEFVINHWLLVTAFCVVSGLLIATVANGAGGVSASQAVLEINRKGAVVVDIRSAEDFASAHIIDAINIPRGELDQATQRLRKHKGKPVLVCCATGSSSAAAVRKLRADGFEQVLAIKGGVAAWRQENFPLASA